MTLKNEPGAIWSSVKWINAGQNLSNWTQPFIDNNRSNFVLNVFSVVRLCEALACHFVNNKRLLRYRVTHY